MKLLSSTPILWVANVKATIDFYVNILQFTPKNYSEEWDWAYIEKDDVKIMLSRPNIHMPFEKSVFTGSLYIETDDVDNWWNLLKDKVEVVYSLETFPWNMKEFAIKDLNGYILNFGQSV